MTQDIAIVVDSETGARDITIGSNGDLLQSDGFDTSIDNSILVNRRASSEEVPQAQERRGWIGDLFPRREGFKVGSKIWLFEQRRRTQDVINAIRDAAQEALQWMIDEGQVERIEVTAEAVGSSGVRLQIQIFVGNNRIKRYFTLWTDTKNREIA